jgi:glycerol-3-phosphate dehydrogenase subunit C
MSHIPRRPVGVPAVHPDEPRYWDRLDLEGELRRTFQVCHECRMCVGYCGSFPAVFAAVDRDIESGRADGAERTTAADFARVSDLCWQCKLCYIKCPYTEDEGAAELLDFPRLMAREKAQRARREGVKLVDRILGEPALLGKLGGGLAAPLTNFVNRNRLARKVAEKVAGISAEFPLPLLEAQTFERWLARHTPLPSAGAAGEVAIFSTCYGDYNQTSVPQAAVRVLEHQGFRVNRPAGQVCCGMPNLDGGDVEAMRAKVRANVDALAPAVAAGQTIVVGSPTCGYTMKKEWPMYDDRPATRAVAAATQDLMQFLDGLRRARCLKTDFARGLGAVTYHAACHLRAQKIAFPGLRVLSAIPDTEVRLVEQCSAVDGTWGMKAEFYELGRKYARKLVRGIEEAEGDLVVTDCALSALRIQKENRVAVQHPVEALMSAYGLAATDAGDPVDAPRTSQAAAGASRDAKEEATP